MLKHSSDTKYLYRKKLMPPPYSPLRTPTVGEALIWVPGTGLKDEFTEDTKTAWVAVYTLVAGTMKAAAAEEAA